MDGWFDEKIGGDMDGSKMGGRLDRGISKGMDGELAEQMDGKMGGGMDGGVGQHLNEVMDGGING